MKKNEKVNGATANAQTFPFEIGNLKSSDVSVEFEWDQPQSKESHSIANASREDILRTVQVDLQSAYAVLGMALTTPEVVNAIVDVIMKNVKKPE